MLRAKHVDGVVMIPSQDPLGLIQPLQQARIPTVILEHDLSGQHCVAVDDAQGGWLGAQHLLVLGHRRVGLIRRTPSTATSSQRFTGYRQALQEAGAMRQLLALAEPPTAVFTHNDVLALGAMHAIRSAGLDIPGDMSVVGYDDIASAAYLGPPLTTVMFPKEEMGRRAAEMILRLARHRGELSPRTLTLPVKLVVRSSSGPPHKSSFNPGVKQ
jgi:DNA-binding LacI/PurR family transcriptional regulator